MSLIVSIPTNGTVIAQPAHTVELHGEITIQRVVDLPADKKVFVLTKELGKIDLPSLSNDNYDTPNEWTNADIVLAVQEYVNSLLPPTSDVNVDTPEETSADIIVEVEELPPTSDVNVDTVPEV